MAARAKKGQLQNIIAHTIRGWEVNKVKCTNSKNTKASIDIDI